jgi:phage terminase small subunit
MARLTGRQQAFVDQLPLCDFNGTAAAIKAKYSVTTAPVTASRLLRNANVQKALSEAAQKRSERTGIDADWVLNRLAAEANADLADIYLDDGGLKPVSQWPKIWRQGLVSGIDSHQEFDYIDGEKIPAGIVKKIRISDRVKRIELIGKHV